MAVTREFQPPDVTSCKLTKLAFLSTATTGTMWTERELLYIGFSGNYSDYLGINLFGTTHGRKRFAKPHDGV